MRVVVGIIAALVTLGLAAFGIVAAQKATRRILVVALRRSMSFHRRKQRTRRDAACRN